MTTISLIIFINFFYEFRSTKEEWKGRQSKEVNDPLSTRNLELLSSNSDSFEDYLQPVLKTIVSICFRNVFIVLLIRKIKTYKPIPIEK